MTRKISEIKQDLKQAEKEKEAAKKVWNIPLFKQLLEKIEKLKQELKDYRPAAPVKKLKTYTFKHANAPNEPVSFNTYSKKEAIEEFAKWYADQFDTTIDAARTLATDCKISTK